MHNTNAFKIMKKSLIDYVVYETWDYIKEKQNRKEYVKMSKLDEFKSKRTMNN